MEDYITRMGDGRRVRMTKEQIMSDIVAGMADGADAVVKYEVVEVLDGDGNEGSRVRFTAPVAEGENVRAAGLEAHAQEVVMRAGETVTAAGAGLLASAGAAEVEIHRRPVLGIISIGSELVAPDRVPARGQIRDANSSALMAQSLEAGAAPEFLGIVPDDEDLIARAVLEYCAGRRLGAKTMFATHYHELTALEGGVKGVRNYYITARKQGGKLIFLRKIVRGAADESYGIEVAKLAGVPEQVVARAREYLSELSSAPKAAPAPAGAEADMAQLSLGAAA